MKKISIVSILVIIIDRILKIFVEKFFVQGVRNTVIPNFFYLTFCKNTGAAFSILKGKTFLLILVAIICLYLIAYTLRKKSILTKMDIISYGLLVGGILGNLIDRINYGYVIDYLDFTFYNIGFAIFNFADMAIVIGAILIILFSKGSEQVE